MAFVSSAAHLSVSGLCWSLPYPLQPEFDPDASGAKDLTGAHLGREFRGMGASCAAECRRCATNPVCAGGCGTIAPCIPVSPACRCCCCAAQAVGASGSRRPRCRSRTRLGSPSRWRRKRETTQDRTQERDAGADARLGPTCTVVLAGRAAPGREARAIWEVAAAASASAVPRSTPAHVRRWRRPSYSLARRRAARGLALRAAAASSC